MTVVQQILEDAPDLIAVPADLRHRRLEVTFKTLDESPVEKDANGWPVGVLESTYGSLPDLPEREPQGEYEIREPFE